MDGLRRHMTFSNVVAMLALFVALGGTGYAALKLPKNSVGTTQIRTNGVGASEIKANAVGASEIKSGAVRNGEVAANAVDGTKVLDGSMGTLDLGDNAVTGAKILDGSIGLLDLGDNAVTGAKVAAGEIGNTDLSDNAVTSAKVADGEIGNTDLSDTAVTGAKVVDGTLGSGDVAPNTFLGGTVSTAFFKAPADLANGASQSYQVFCPAGKIALGGGQRGDDTLSEETIITNMRPAISSSNPEPPLTGGGFTGWRATVVNPTGGATSGIRPEVWVICAAAP